MHPLQGASFLSTSLQGGILKPPALRVVDDWLQVSGAAELAQIDQRVGQQLHAIVPLLDSSKRIRSRCRVGREVTRPGPSPDPD